MLRRNPHPSLNGRLGADLATEKALNKTAFVYWDPCTPHATLEGRSNRGWQGTDYYASREVLGLALSPSKVQAMRPTWKERFLRSPSVRTWNPLSRVVWARDIVNYISTFFFFFYCFEDHRLVLLEFVLKWMLANLYLISLRSLFLRMCLWKKKSLTCKAFGHTPSKKNRVENADKAIANATNPCNNKKLEHCVGYAKRNTQNW